MPDTSFAKPPGTIYLDGNSLGLLEASAEDALRHAVDAWRNLAIRGWTDGDEPWFGMSRRAAALLAPLLGADPVGVAVGQSTTANLHQLLASFYDPSAPAPGILIDATAFPSDRYAVESHLRLRGKPPACLRTVSPRADRLLHEADIVAALERGVGFAVLPAVVYTTGQRLNERRLTAAGRKCGVRIIWDCSHSAGVVPHQFADDDIDLAIGCGYKYLNGGPGAVGWLYVRPELCDRLPGMAGWFGCDPARQFRMDDAFHPAADAGRFLLSTPHVFSLAPLLAALARLNEVGITALRTRSLELTAHLRRGVEAACPSLGIPTPATDARGGHLALTHPLAGAVARVLRERGVVPDFRPPDIVRLAPSPMVTTLDECDRAVAILAEILSSRAHERQADAHALVT